MSNYEKFCFVFILQIPIRKQKRKFTLIVGQNVKFLKNIEFPVKCRFFSKIHFSTEQKIHFLGLHNISGNKNLKISYFIFFISPVFVQYLFPQSDIPRHAFIYFMWQIFYFAKYTVLLRLYLLSFTNIEHFLKFEIRTIFALVGQRTIRLFSLYYKTFFSFKKSNITIFSVIRYSLTPDCK